jgi:hypothetical protein
MVLGSPRGRNPKSSQSKQTWCSPDCRSTQTEDRTHPGHCRCCHRSRFRRRTADRCRPASMSLSCSGQPPIALETAPGPTRAWSGTWPWYRAPMVLQLLPLRAVHCPVQFSVACSTIANGLGMAHMSTRCLLAHIAGRWASVCHILPGTGIMLSESDAPKCGGSLTFLSLQGRHVRHGRILMMLRVPLAAIYVRNCRAL